MCQPVVVTPTQQLIADRLGADLDATVQAARDAGDSWDVIAARLTARTGIAVNGESVRRWNLRAA